MSTKANRREFLIGAGAVATTVASPGSAIATSLAEQAEFAAFRWPLWEIRYMMSALSLLKHHSEQAGLSPATYGEEIGYALRYAVFAGWAVRTETGHLRITEAGRREHELEILDNRS
jgi:hypothetical protein